MRTTALLPLLAALLAPSLPSAAPVAVGPVTFDLPEGLIPGQTGPMPLLASWTDPKTGVGILVLETRMVDPVAAASELESGETLQRRLIRGFGEAQVREAANALRVPCRYTGTPIRDDLDRLAAQVTVDMTCETPPRPREQRTQLLSILTRSGNVVVRIDAGPEAREAARLIANRIWPTLTVVEAQRLEAPGIVQRFWVEGLLGLLLLAVAAVAVRWWRRRAARPAATSQR
ncbi:MAG: hypothetical protein QM767_12230 [Anaeromyxobacter sp.]